MEYVITENVNATEEEAHAEITARGWHPFTLEFDTVEEEFHYHDWDTVLYVLEGTAAAEFPDGSTFTAGAGARVDATAGLVHRDVPGLHYRAVFGFATHPDTWTGPINKPVTVEA